MTEDGPAALFVYGTLKSGEANHVLLAPYVRSIERASIAGRLHDVGDFPALAEGEGRVHGELIRLDPKAMPRALAVIDRLEGCVPGDDAASLYLRRSLEVRTAGGGTERAYTYYYNSAHGALPPLEHLPVVESGEWRSPAVAPGPTDDPEMEEFREWVRTYRDRPL